MCIFKRKHKLPISYLFWHCFPSLFQAWAFDEFNFGRIVVFNMRGAVFKKFVLNKYSFFGTDSENHKHIWISSVFLLFF